MANLDEVTIAASTGERAYTKPAITHELKLETRAGSMEPPGLRDPLGLDPTQNG